jgi:AcrR family transcriptional regulator
MAIDRRVLRTRTALYDALVRLIRRKDYELITVEDILAEANVGRATFYAHFTSKDDLLRRSLDRLRQLLLAAQEPGMHAPFPLDSGWSPSRTLFEHIAEFAEVSAALAGGRGAAILRNAINDVLAGVLRETMPPGQVDGFPRELAILHVVSTIDTVLRWWLEHRRDLAPEEADALFRNLAFRGLPEAALGSFTVAPEPQAS